MRFAAPAFPCLLAIVSAACGGDPNVAPITPQGGSSAIAGAGGASGATGAAGLGGAAPAYLSGRAGVEVTATRGLTCNGSCATTMAGPFLTSTGELVVGGSLAGPLTMLDGATHDATEPRYDGYFAVVSANDLGVATQRVFSGPASTAGMYATAAGDGVVVVGPLSGQLDVGGPTPLSGDGSGGFVAAYDATGALRFSRPLPSSSVGAIAGHRSGAFAVGFYAPGNVDLGCGPIDAPLGASLVVVFDPAGGCVRQRLFGGFANTTVVDALAFGVEGGEVAIVGRFHDTLTVGDRTLIHDGEAAFLVDFLPDGDLRWLRKVATTGPAPRLSMARDAFGGFVVTTMASRPLDFAFGSKPAVEAETTSAHAHVARYDYEGLPLWHVALAPTTIDDITPAVTADGFVFVGGSFTGTIDLGDGLRESAGRSDAWLARLENGGAVRWSVRWGGAYDEGIEALLATKDALFVRGMPPPATGSLGSAPSTVGISRLTRP